MSSDDAPNVVALIDRARVMTLADRRGLSTLPETELWPDLAQIAAAAGVAQVMPLGPARRVVDPEAVIHVVSGQGASSLAGASWTRIDALAGRDVPTVVGDVIAGTVDEHHGTAAWPARRPAWFRDGWLAEADAWADDAIAATGRRRMGPTVPVRMWSLSAVLRIPVAGASGDESVWFKATCEWFRAEPAITDVVGTFAADHVPTLVAVDRDRAWMLMTPLPGPDLRDQPTYAPIAAAAIASTQRSSIGHLGSLTAAGCPDRTLQPTLDALHGLVHGSIELDALTSEERGAAVAAESWIAEQIGELFAGAIPSTIVHGDCHLGNVAADGDRAVLYDWTDACVSHPFLDGVLLARSAGDEHDDVIKAAYTASWREEYPDAEVDRTWELAKFGNRVFQAISYEGIYRAQEERSRWEMSGIVANTLRALGREFAAG
jgi:hypothetical protein